jgi:two-component system, chemotaxis family, sensor kinase CheA
MDEIIKEFLLETRENLEQLNKDLLALEKQPDNGDLLSSVFRTLHTIKGSAGFLNLPKLEKLGHDAESLLSLLREGQLRLDSELVTLLFAGVDGIKEILSRIEESGGEGEEDYEEIHARLEAVCAMYEAPDDGIESLDFEELSSYGAAVSAQEASEAPSLSLDDLAALLIQLRPDDTEGLRRVGRAMREIADEAAFPVKILKPVMEAADLLDEAADKKGKRRAALLERIGRLIEEASSSQEEFGPCRQEVAPAPATAAVTRSPEEFQLPADYDPDLLREYVTESREYIESAEAALLSLEVDPDDLESVSTVFRAFHTIKGTSAFLGVKLAAELAHHAESLLVKMRDREIRCSGKYADLALRSVDLLKAVIGLVPAALSGQPMKPPDGYEELLSLLSNPENVAESQTHLRVGDLLVAAEKVERAQVNQVAVDKGDQPIGVALVKSKAASLTDVAKALRTQQQLSGADRSAESSVRVRTERLDRLIDMVGELVIAQSMVVQDPNVQSGGNPDLSKKINHAAKIVRELQDLSMSMRMVPFRATFQKVARLVRDLAYKSGKQVEFVPEGEDTEIDRNMVDAITDPLVHMVRNAVDHGIEQPDVRQQQGKSPVGIIRLAAFHSGGNVVIELQDDGTGLDREKIMKKAVASGLIESEKQISDNDLFNLIFAAGFSTASQVTDVSGRGVGMDVVRKNIEALRGRITINSIPGQGCTFWLHLPLTLAITDGMLVKVGRECYIIPTINIHLSFRPDREALSSIAGKADLVMLRGDLMPLFRLYRLFGIPDAIEDPHKGLLVVVGDGDRRCALLVDELLGQQQVVAKSLGQGLGKIQGVSGGAILGDGRVGLILDTPELVALARNGIDLKNGVCRSAA